MRFFFSIIWLGFGVFWFFNLLAHGEGLGGAQYFSHTNQAGSAAFQIIIITGCIVMAIWSAFKLPGITWAGRLLGAIALVYGFSPYLPFGIAPYLAPFYGITLLMPFVVAGFGFFATLTEPGPKSATQKTSM